MPSLLVPCLYLLCFGTVDLKRATPSEVTVLSKVGEEAQVMSAGEEVCSKITTEYRLPGIRSSGGNKKMTADPAWKLKYEEEDDHCQCACTTAECYECGRGHLEEVDGEMKCMSDVKHVPAEDSKTHNHAPCGPDGGLTIVGGKPICTIPSTCPPVPKGSGFTAKLKSECFCTYELECESKRGAVVVQAKEEAGSLICTYRSDAKEIQSREFEGELSCISPFKLVGNKCAVEQECREPISISLSQEALACGPQTPEFIAHMFDQMVKIQEDGALPQLHVQCAMNCVSVFAKMSECYGQTLGVCLGTDVQSTRKGEAKDHLDMDKTNRTTASWLVKSSSTTALPCHHLFASARTLSSTKGKTHWDEMVDVLQEKASDRYIELQGNYKEFPTQPISCRDAFCKKIATMKYGNPGKVVLSNSQCFQSCEEKFADKKLYAAAGVAAKAAKLARAARAKAPKGRNSRGE